MEGLSPKFASNDCNWTQYFTLTSSKEFLDIQATIMCGFTLKRVRDIIRFASYI